LRLSRLGDSCLRCRLQKQKPQDNTSSGIVAAAKQPQAKVSPQPAGLVTDFTTSTIMPKRAMSSAKLKESFSGDSAYGRKCAVSPFLLRESFSSSIPSSKIRTSGPVLVASRILCSSRLVLFLYWLHPAKPQLWPTSMFCFSRLVLHSWLQFKGWQSLKQQVVGFRIAVKILAGYCQSAMPGRLGNHM
jgi:hypothetical protein